MIIGALLSSSSGCWVQTGVGARVWATSERKEGVIMRRRKKKGTIREEWRIAIDSEQIW